ncbi:hypothetical protein [Mesorhizobium hawassense]|uniref:hypothetical protein n=1 Tax=Mesorhizobium hawassense TaxID=1209954 RepID=UPI00142D55B0|nr:hypothetical protein [Mesorhizobium hawassense]
MKTTCIGYWNSSSSAAINSRRNVGTIAASAQDVGGGPMSAALLKLVLLALLRRCLVSTNAWVERFSILSDPPIARAFAEMASRPSVPHTVQSLSHAVGLSRSAFMARFSAAFGESRCHCSAG